MFARKRTPRASVLLSGRHGDGIEPSILSTVVKKKKNKKERMKRFGFAETCPCAVSVLHACYENYFYRLMQVITSCYLRLALDPLFAVNASILQFKSRMGFGMRTKAVSYTHLTLPTIDDV